MPKICIYCGNPYFSRGKLFCSHTCYTNSKIQDINIRFWSKVNKGNSDECWEWTAYKTRAGYGQFWFNSTRQYAHRVAWILAYGKISEGMDILHNCDNPACVNYLSHLFEGTHQDNMDDMNAKGRQLHLGQCGIKNGSAVLTEKQIIEIRELYLTEKNKSKIGRIYNVSHTTIFDIVNGLHWKNI